IEEVYKAIASKSIHPLDAAYLDAGHPWKTNPADLKQTMERAGFRDVLLYQRANHLARPTAGSRTHLEATKRRLIRLHRISFGLSRPLLKAFFPSRVPRALTKLFYALERRVSFGANRLANSHAQEAFVIGRITS
ncbi:MAG TPA: hypothetical protein VGU23_05235, partial [Acidobacteriaceae bacterium]|nr:hypothetical protein [Acidobacteriaceae bacterium]